ncbi:PTS cellobiose transporter subunit IIA [Halolactibacillus alkaliphilus]|uniref:PTS cellobiose transporter subunit IIA n=1 Tax=Halolactibacillus alkaliphilus TaxID=442899 RepID=A0A511X2I7_9BACI|nr:PTS lactose/cellobiose transporter subunit IIA [Halolactibacillus alkaliphilus]GEN57167.1 PTS cellobiose transporter subunit IIA [Halolactibacillus alkaliphilus]GGN72251.1 PTS cellobiose transporter subunit IIA [Halolactibacillus alkaliphilus]SFO88615.1 PTS system, cellobiose-specific IIA component [Halolactibacillus alkaliphilus]
MIEREKIQQRAFKIIAEAGSAKSLAILALQSAKNKQVNEATKKLEQARRYFNEAHQYHRDLIQQEASGENVTFSLVFMHAEDQLMSTETVIILVEELIEMYDYINGKCE